jgi:very-short-patch-repair endonuclease
VLDKQQRALINKQKKSKTKNAEELRMDSTHRDPKHNALLKSKAIKDLE